MTRSKKRRIVNAFTRLFGFMLTGLGLLGDLMAGVAVLDREMIVPGLILHLIAASMWLGGMTILRQTSNLAIMLGVTLFPGIGTLGWTLASGIAGLLHRPEVRVADIKGETDAVDPLTLIQTVTETPAQVLTDAKIQPISEVLYTADSMMKRAALSLICREPSPQSASLARHLLADPDPDVRALAAVAVSLLESRLSDSVKSALKQVETQPRDPACYSRLGRLYLESAGESVTDSINRRFYLTQARSAFKKAISLDPKRNGDQIELAETLMNLGDIAEASAAINKVLSKRTTDSRAYLLAIELAFRERRFDQVLSLAKQARETLPANDKALATIQWWLAKEYADENV